MKHMARSLLTFFCCLICKPLPYRTTQALEKLALIGAAAASVDLMDTAFCALTCPARLCFGVAGEEAQVILHAQGSGETPYSTTDERWGQCREGALKHTVRATWPSQRCGAITLQPLPPPSYRVFPGSTSGLHRAMYECYLTALLAAGRLSPPHANPQVYAGSASRNKYDLSTDLLLYLHTV